MAVTHSVVKIAGQKLFAVADWNAEHTIDGNTGEILFNDGGLILTDSNLFWDNVNKRLGIGTASPTARTNINSDNNVLANLGSPNNYHLILRNEQNDNNQGVGIGFTISSSTFNMGSVILYKRTGSQGIGELQFYTKTSTGAGAAPTQKMVIDVDGNVGIRTPTPTILHSVNEKAGMTEIGGHCIKLTNKTGVNSVAGKVVEADGATDDAVELNAAGGDHPIGVFLDSGITDGSEAWVVVGGIADVLLDDNVAAVRGQWMGSGVGIGYARTQPAPPAAWHGDEIGHCIESVAATGGGTHILARCVLHFN